MRHTKIIATIGPASRSPAAITALIDAGVDVFRLNFSHGTHDEHGAVLNTIRRVSREKLRRKTSTPASISAVMAAGLREAGPMVAMIFVCLTDLSPSIHFG